MEMLFIFIGVIVVALYLFFKLETAYNEKKDAEKVVPFRNSQTTTQRKDKTTAAPTLKLSVSTSDDIVDSMRTYIAGVQHRCNTSDIGGYLGHAVPEPNNAYDPEAVALISADGKHLGYIPKDSKEEYKSHGGLRKWPFVGYIQEGDKYPVIGNVKILFTNNQDEFTYEVTKYAQWLVENKGVKFLPKEINFNCNPKPKTKDEILAALDTSLDEQEAELFDDSGDGE